MLDLGWNHMTAADKADILDAIRDGHASHGPYHVEIYPADRCNIDCFFCSTAMTRGTDELSLLRMESLVDELVEIGTRSIRFAGGGEPLFHRGIKSILRKTADAGLPIENITTNAIIIDDEMAELLTRTTDHLMVSLNTGDAETYASMMKTPAKNFDRVLENVRRVVRARKATGSKRPQVTIQFLCWKENYRSIPRMYELAMSLGVDSISFNGLSFLRPEQQMSDSEVDEMMSLYEDVCREDGFRTIVNISSYERPINHLVDDMILRLSRERSQRPLVARAARLIRRDGLYAPFRWLEHRKRIRENATAADVAGSLPDACIIGWYSMVVRADGMVAPCCMMQDRNLGNIHQQSVREIWFSPRFDRLRRELRQIMELRESWKVDTDADAVLETRCGMVGEHLCPMKTFYFVLDTGFVERLKTVFAECRTG